jgi:RNA recognition motif-containing protein
VDSKPAKKRSLHVTHSDDDHSDEEHEEEQEEEEEDVPVPQPVLRASVAVTKLLVTNLPHNITESEIKKTFGEVGHVIRADLKVDSKGDSMGVMDVYVTNATIGQKIVECFDRIKLGGQEIRVNVLATDVRLGKYYYFMFY